MPCCQRAESSSEGNEHVDLDRRQLGRERGQALELPFGISVFDDDVATLDIADVAQSLVERFHRVGDSGAVGRQKTYSRDRGRLLGFSGARRSDDAPSNPANERSTVHLDLVPLTLKARPY